MIFYERLANAIVEQAAKDYRDAAKKLMKPNIKEKDRYQAEKMKKDCERFFLGEHIKTLTTVDGRYILEKLEKEVLTSQS